MKRIIRYLINTKDLCVKYGESDDLIGYSDSDFASDVDTRKGHSTRIDSERDRHRIVLFV